MGTFNDPEHKAEAAKTIRTLVDKIVLTPNEDGSELVVDMKGDLAAILSVADARAKARMPKAADQMETSERKEIEQVDSLICASVESSDPCEQQGKGRMVAGACFVPTLAASKAANGLLVAGAGFEPATFRL